jgi:hypothetical protein
MAWYMLQLYTSSIEVERKWGNIMKLFPNKLWMFLFNPVCIQSWIIKKFLDDDDVQLYQRYIGVLRWAVELGKIHLAHAAGAMERFAAAPMDGHMYMVIRIFAYFKKHIDSKLVFDPLLHDFNGINWLSHDWKHVS